MTRLGNCRRERLANSEAHKPEHPRKGIALTHLIPTLCQERPKPSTTSTGGTTLTGRRDVAGGTERSRLRIERQITMEWFKVDNFLTSSKDAFPSFSSLTQDECHKILCRLKDALGLNGEHDSLAIVTELSNRQVACLNTNAESEGFDLQQTLRNLGVNAEKNIFINWYRFDNIDRMECAALSNHFTDIWYPSSDDIDIFDSSLRWILSIRHDGCVYFNTFS